MTHSIKSMRSFLIGSLHDFARSANLDVLAKTENLTSLVVSLAHYQEEGAKFAPEVYVCAQIERLVRLVPNHQIVKLGETDDAESAIEQGLKKGAPLAMDGWCIYVDAVAPRFRYGVFRGSISPLALNIEKIVLSAPVSDCPVVRIVQVAPGCIEVRNALDVVHTIIFSDRRDEEIAPQAYFDEFVDAICSAADDGVRDSLRSYFASVLGRGLQESHGALMVVVSSDEMPKFLRDGVTLTPAIVFVQLLKDAGTTAGDAVSAEQALMANAALLKGMIRSDGITVFTATGVLLGYNCFIKSSRGCKNVAGGARARAYNSLVEKLGHGLNAVFSRSQDGMIKFARRQ